MATTQVTPFQLTDQFTMDNFNERINETNTALGNINTVLSERPNPNLLDNWYFGNPVNQRGQTSYTGAGYTIDRWILSNTGTMLLQSDGVSCSSDTYPDGQMWERMDKSIMSYLEGKTVTASAVINGELRTESGIVSNGAFGSYLRKNWDGYNGTSFVIAWNNGDVILGGKLELGSTQTLAHQDDNGNWVLNEIPDYGEQLIRCQRYLQKLILLRSFAVSLDENGGYTTFQLPVVMRITPVITPISLGGIVGNNKSSTISEVRVAGYTGYNLTLMFKTSTTMAGNTAPVGYLYDTQVWLSAEL